jgi:hypothetical protein
MLNRIVWVVFFIGISVGLFAQSNPITYAKEWEEIDSLITKKDLPKSALQKVSALKILADNANLGDQSIKCLLYQLGLEEKITENNPNSTIEGIKQALQKANNPIQQSILSAILAKQYWNYFNLHRYEVFNKKTTNAIDSNDVRSFAANQLHGMIQYYFERSITQKSLLINTPLSKYNALILQGSDSTKLFSLYDLLVDEALEYYKGNEFGSPDFVNNNVWMNDQILSETKTFLTANFTNGKGNNKNWRAIQLFQALLLTHQSDKDPTIFVRINLERIEWANRMGEMNNKEWLYQNSLKEIIENFKQAPTAIRAYYLLAELEIVKARGYQPYGDTSNRFGYSKALTYLEKAKQVFGQTAWENNGLYRLTNEIEGRQLFAKIEKINQPKKPFRALINYRNTDSLYGRIIKIDPLKWKESWNYTTSSWHFLTQLSSVDEIAYSLPASPDHQQHAVEIKIDALPTGSYILLLSSGKLFDTSKDHFSANYFSVSNLTYYRDGSQFFIRNLETGKPIDGALVNVFTRENNHYTPFNKTISNDNGSFVLKNPFKKQPAFCFEIKKGKDYLFSTDNEYLTLPEDINPPIETVNDEIANQQNKQLFFFTDRALYRPGQTVQFKAIAITRGKSNNSNKLFLSNTTIVFYLKNANQQKIDSVQLSLNEFGSVSGRFILPEKGLTGNYRIESASFKYSNAYFSVEEYKRPSFSILFDQNKKVYRYNDSVFVKGRAIAYAGNALNNTKVKYSISQVNHLIQPLSRKSYPFNNRANAFLISGETTSNINGEFIIPFKTLLQENFGDQFISYYTIETSVTDLNGETHSNTTMITASNKPIEIRIQAPQIVNKANFNSIKAIALNAINQNTDATIKISLFKLNDPGLQHRVRLWQRPDQFIIPEKAYQEFFPDDEYNDESNEMNWSLFKLNLVDSIVVTTTKPTIAIPTRIIESGIYKIIAITTDSLGNISSAEHYVQVYDSTKSNFGLNADHFLQSNVVVAQPNDTARFITGSSAGLIYLTRKINKANETIGTYSFLEKKGIEQWEIIPNEKDRGNIIINDAFVYKGRLYTQQYRVEVPFSNKHLKIEYGSYRKINEPGKKEEWNIIVSGPDGSTKAAELLTSMYDASLDDLKPHQWYSPNLWNTINWASSFTSTQFGIGISNEFEKEKKYSNVKGYKKNTIISSLDLYLGFITVTRFAFASSSSKVINDRVTFSTDQNEKALAGSNQEIMIRGTNTVREEDYDKVYTRVDVLDPITGNRIVNGRIIDKANNSTPVQIRKNFNETAFFFPQLYADSTGKYRFSFTLPDAVTKWKWMSLAHTKDLAFGLNTEELITQKTLMVQPNAPRFMREGDNMEFSSKIVNLSNKELTGTVSLALIDATTNRSVDGWFQNVFPNQYFTAEAGQSVVVKFPIQIPFSFNKALTWKIVAKAGDYSDGEENTLPVITSRQLVTESLPIFLEKDTTVQFNFTKLLNTNSATATNQLLSVEYTSNPLWNVVKALPYLMESTNESADQLFHRFYANQLATYIVQKNPVIQSVFESWKKDSSSLKSNLEKNTVLKQILLAETPWVLESANESEQQKRIAQLFDAAKLSIESNDLIEQLNQLQLEDGSFPWFKGGNSDEFMTNTILTGLGKLKKIGAIDPGTALRLRPMMVKAINYADNIIERDYQYLLSQKIDLTKPVPNYRQLNYLFMRSFYGDISLKFPNAQQYFYQQSKTYWNKLNTYSQGMLTIITSRNNERAWAVKNILPSLLENTIINSKQGMYWKNPLTQYWYANPIEFQSMMINCFSEINQEEKNIRYSSSINSMRTWLILNKQTNHWKTGIATAEACYALLVNGSSGMNALNNKKQVQIKMGNLLINSANEKTIAGTGYFQKTIEGEKIVPEMGNIQLTVSNNNKIVGESQPSYGAIYWQYIEDLDKISSSNGPLTITKQLFVEQVSGSGKILKLLKDNDEIQLGQKLVVQLKIQSDRDMEYIQVKDLRAAAMEPINVLSGYKWENRLTYYESTKDVSSNFYISNLAKGSYTLSYEMNAIQIGIFSVGIASLQSIYAPEFNSHSNGIKIRIKE